MKKFLMGLRYGNWWTKLYVISIPVCYLAGIGLIITAILTNRIYLYLIGIIIEIIAVSLNFGFTIDIADGTGKGKRKVKEPKAERDKKQKKQKPKETVPKSEQGKKTKESTVTIRESVTDESNTKKDKQEAKVRKAEKSKPKTEAPETEKRKVETEIPETEKRKPETAKSKKRKQKRITKESKPLVDEHEEKQSEATGEAEEENDGVFAKKAKTEKHKLKAKKQKEDSTDGLIGEPENANDRTTTENPIGEKDKAAVEEPVNEFLSYDEKKIKQVFYRYKVRKEHRMIMIDEWKEKDIHQNPAYIWVQRGQLHLLVIGEDTREFSVPVSKAATMSYHRGVVCQAKNEYLQFRKESLLKRVFSPYLPVYHEGNKNGRPVIYKNLFELGDGIRITNTSAKVIMDMFQPEILVDDIVTRDLRYNAFYKEIYKHGILFREQLITAKGYQDRINDTLQNLARADISQQEYEETVQLLFQKNLISQEYVTYYQQYRKRLQVEEQQNMKEQGKRKKTTKRM